MISFIAFGVLVFFGSIVFDWFVEAKVKFEELKSSSLNKQ